MESAFVRQVTETQRASEPLEFNDRVLIPIEKIRFETHALGSAYWHYITSEPAAIIVIDEQGVHALSLENRPIPLDVLLERIDGLQRIIDNLRLGTG